MKVSLHPTAHIRGGYGGGGALSTAHSCITIQKKSMTIDMLVNTILHQTVQWDIYHATAMSFNRHVPITSWVTVQIQEMRSVWLFVTQWCNGHWSSCAAYAHFHTTSEACQHFQTYFAHNRPLSPHVTPVSERNIEKRLVRILYMILMF